jgi:DNA-binding transcriptional ArsR family regulator
MQTNLDATFAALAEPTRKAVIGLLSRGPKRAGDLAEEQWPSIEPPHRPR